MATYRLWPATSGDVLASDNTATDLGIQFSITQPGCNFGGYWYWLPATARPPRTGPRAAAGRPGSRTGR